MRSDLFPGAPSRENRLLCLITFRCIVADSRSRRYPIGRTVCIGKSLNGRADRAHIRCANPQRPERSFQALPLLSLAEVGACFRRTLESEAPVHDEDGATEASPSTSRSPTVQAAVPNSLTSRSIYFPEVRLAFTDRAGAPPRICFGALAPACEWAPWIVLRCRLVGIGSYVRAWLSLFVCQVSVAASLVLHGGLVRPCHGGGFRRSRIIVMVGIHILLRECSLGSEGDRRDRENQKHSSNRFHTAPLKGIECLIVKSGDGCFRSSAANASRPGFLDHMCREFAPSRCYRQGYRWTIRQRRCNSLVAPRHRREWAGNNAQRDLSRGDPPRTGAAIRVGAI